MKTKPKPEEVLSYAADMHRAYSVPAVEPVPDPRKRYDRSDRTDWYGQIIEAVIDRGNKVFGGK